jgi:CHAT domain-containing protein/Flp pilus assembly protein TadD
LLALALLGFVCCSGPRNPQAEFDSAQRTFQHGDLIRAQQEAMRGYERFRSSRPEWALKFRILEAEALTWRGMYKEALSPLAAVGSSLKQGDMAIRMLAIEGTAYARLQEFNEATKKLQEAEHLCATSAVPVCGEVIRAWGILAWERGEFLQAKRFFERALAFARSHGDRFIEATALLNLGAVSLREEHFDQAIDWSESAYTLSTALQAGVCELNALGNLGWAYYRIGESEKALEFFLRARNQARQLGSITGEVGWLTTAGYVYLDDNKLELAEQTYQEALELARPTDKKEDIVDALMSLALVYEQKGKLKEASSYADEAIAMVPADGNRQDLLYPLLVKGHVAARVHDVAKAEQIFRQVSQDPKNNASLKWEAEHSLARLYEVEHQDNSAEQEYRAALSTFETARSTLQHEDSQLPFLTNASRIYDDYIHFLVTQGKTGQALQVADYSRARTLSEGLGLLRKGTSFSPQPVNAQQISRNAGGAILFYWLGEKQSYLWVITPQKTNLFPLPAASEIDAAVKRYRKALAGPQDVLEAGNADGSSLFQTLVEPAVKLLPKNAKVFVVPDGSLNGLNFETLLVSEPQPHYWIEDVTIADASSLRMLGTSRGTNRGSGKLLLFGDARAPNSDYPPLPKAAAEMESIAKHFPPAQHQVFAREQATPPAYLASKPEQFSFIHFVAHGTASRLSPLDSAIVLSKATAEDDSFKLYARDIIHQRLRADLVTISTCYGAGTRAYSGEGLVGLSWAFLRAGAHNVIGALWEVSDASTPQLMDQLYDELGKGKSPGAALRAAKLSLLHSNSAFRKPFYWAPFQLYTGS